jgi:Domain of unknown function (DUF6468)
MGLAEWVLQLLVVALLGAALPYVLRLERELRALRRDRASLESGAAGLGEATRLAEAALLRLRTAAEGSGRQVAETMARAEPLRDDLRYLIERAEALADRMEGQIRAARAAAPAPGGPVAVADPVVAAGGSAPAGGGAAARSRVERELLRALAQGGQARGAR